jgi:hypothetical protein
LRRDLALALVLKWGQIGEPGDFGLVGGSGVLLQRQHFGGLKRWRVFGEPFQFLMAAASVEPIGNIAFRLQAGQFDYPHASRKRGEVGRDSTGMVAARIVVVGQDYNVSPVEECIKFGPPFRLARLAVCSSFRSTPGVAGGDEPEAGKPVGVLLALNREDDAIGGSSDQFREAIGNLPRALHLPNAATSAVRPPLSEILWLEPANLKQQLALLVAVIVSGDNDARGPGGLDLDPELGSQPFDHGAIGHAALDRQ